MLKLINKKLSLLFVLIFSLSFLSGCKNIEGESGEVIKPCEHSYVERIIEEGSCIEKEKIEVICEKCGEIKEIKEGDYKDHKIKEEYIKNPEFNDGNHFIIRKECEICYQIFEVEYVKYKTPHYIKIDERSSEDNLSSLAIYQCLISKEKIEYHFDLDDYNYYVINNILVLEKYKGAQYNNIYIPSTLKINNINIEKINITSECFSNNNSIKNLRINFKNTTLGFRSFSNLASLESINLKDINIQSFTSQIYNCYSLKDIVFPDTIIYFLEGVINCPSITKLDFSNTNLKYFNVDNYGDIPIMRNVQEVFFPSTLRVLYLYEEMPKLKKFTIESEETFGAFYRPIFYSPVAENMSSWCDFATNIFEFSEKVSNYTIYEEFNSQITFVFPDNHKETISLPYGTNLFNNNQYLNMLKENNLNKVGWYYDKYCFDYFFGIVPKKDITLYGLVLDEKDEVFLNKHQFLFNLYDEKYGNNLNSILLTNLTDIVPFLYYMLSNNIYELSFKVDPMANISYQDLTEYIIEFGDDTTYMFNCDGINPEINLTFLEDNFYKISISSYENLRNSEEYALKDAVYLTFNYRSYFKDFDYKENKRSEDYSSFKYKESKYLKEELSNPNIMAYMLSTGINVIPKKESYAEKALLIYEDIARNIFTDNMSDFQKVLACQNYFLNYLRIGLDQGASYSLSGNAIFTNLVEEIPIHGTINCVSAVNFPRLLYAIEGIQLYLQDIPYHQYAVLKIDNKWYISDHILNHEQFKKDPSFNSLRGYKDETDDETMQQTYYGVQFYYPGINLEEYHYSNN